MKKFLILILFLVGILILAYSFAQVKLKALLVEQLSHGLRRQVYIGKVGLELPLHVYIKNLIIFEPAEEEKSLEQFVQIDEVQISPTTLPFFKGKILLRAVYLVRPVINITKLGKTRFNFSDIMTTTVKSSKSSRVNKKIPFLILHLRIKNGQINFVDQTTEGKPIDIALKDLDFYITNVSFPVAEILTRYNFEAKLQEDDLPEEAQISSAGWLNFTKKDMEAQLGLENLDLKYLAPYYKKAVSGQVKSGVLNFTSDIVSLNNDLVAKCKLEVNDFKIDSSDPRGSGIFGVPLESVLAALQDSGNKLSLDFEIKTKFDQPKINFGQIGSSVLSKALEKAVLKTPQFILDIREKIREGGEESLKDISEKLKSLGEEIKKTLGK